MTETQLHWIVRQGEYEGTGPTPNQALASLRRVVPDYPVVAIPAENPYTVRKHTTTKGKKMARKVEYAVQSDMSGVDIPKGDRVIVRFEYEPDAEGNKRTNYVADLTTEEADALRDHVHAREITPRDRTPKDAAEGTEAEVSDAEKSGSKK